jgi:hypothetical protein
MTKYPQPPPVTNQLSELSTAKQETHLAFPYTPMNRLESCLIFTLEYGD